MQETEWACVAIGGGVCSFLFCLFLQVLAWRCGRVRRQMLWLILFHLILPLSFWLTIAAARGEFFPYAPLALFQASLGSAFVMTFPAIQAQSPSLEIVLWIWRRGSCRKEDLTEFHSSSRLLESRRRDLVADGLVRSNGNLSAAGRLLGNFFCWYRKTMRVPEEQG